MPVEWSCLRLGTALPSQACTSPPLLCARSVSALPGRAHLQLVAERADWWRPRARARCILSPGEKGGNSPGYNLPWTERSNHCVGLFVPSFRRSFVLFFGPSFCTFDKRLATRKELVCTSLNQPPRALFLTALFGWLGRVARATPRTVWVLRKRLSSLSL